MTRLTDEQQDFVNSPEFESAFNRWRKQFAAAAMVDLSPTALEPFPYQQTPVHNFIAESPLMPLIELSDTE